MSRSLYKPSATNMVEDFDLKHTIYHKPSGDYYTMLRRGNEYYQQRYQIGFDGKETNVVEERIDYVIGSGDQARSYLHRNAEGKLVELPVTWYAEKNGYWAMSPGYDSANQKDFHGVVSKDCIFCHDAYPSPQLKDIKQSGEPIFQGELPQGIDCQRCHGPGAEHEKAVRMKKLDMSLIRNSIVNPANLGRDRQLEVCMECHLSTSGSQDANISLRFNRDIFSYRPGQPLANYKLYFDFAGEQKAGFEIPDAAYRLRMSSCFKQSKMTCLTCHDPHVESHGKQAEIKYLQVCESCHRGVVHKAALPATESCLSCHMPKRRGEYAVHTVLTDHYIQREKPLRDLLTPMNQVDISATGRGKLSPYYPDKLRDDSEDQLYLAISEIESGADTQSTVGHLETAIKKYSPAEAGFYAALGNAYAKGGRYPDAVTWFDQALQRKPTDRVIVEEMAQSLIASGQLDRAERILASIVDKPPLDAALLTNLGNVYARHGQLEKAEMTLQRSISVDPELAQAYNLLGLVQKRKGNEAEAERLYREAIRFRPDLAEARNNLAELLVADGRYDEAEFEFNQAIASAPALAEVRHSYGLLLIVKKSYSQAETELREAVRLEPDTAIFHSDLADLLMQRGSEAEAGDQYAEALRLDPNLDTANIGMGMMLIRRGDVMAGRNYCTEALRSSDSDIREQAAACLRGQDK